MGNPFNNLDEALKFLESKAIRTSAGDFVKLKDVQEVVESARQAEEAKKEELPIPYRMTAEKARRLAKMDLKDEFPQTPAAKEPGKSVPARAESSSRT